MTKLHAQVGTTSESATAGTTAGGGSGAGAASGATGGKEQRHAGGEAGGAERSARLPGLIASWDRDGICRMASAGHLEWFGLRPDQVVGRHVREVLGGRLYEKNLPFLEAALAGREQVYESSVRDGAGRQRHFEITYVPDRSEDGVVCGVFVQAMDVTQRVRAQLDLADAQTLAGVGSWAWERDLGFTLSEQAKRIIGGDPHTWSATVDAGVAAIHPDDRSWLAERHLAAIARGEGWEAVHRVLRPDGEVRHVHSRARTELAPDGRLLRTWGTVLDVTEQRRLQEEVESHNQRLSDTMAMLGHDVRQPLTVVLGFLDEATQVLRADDMDGEAVMGTLRACVERASRGGARMRRLLDDILAVASVDAGTLVARPERVRLSELLETVVEEVGVETTISGAEGTWVRADLFHVRQALTNLLVNATKYGRPPFEVSVGVVDGMVELCVADHGPGVPDDFVPDLFGRFSRGSRRANGDRSSTGLGLHLVRSLVEVNGGAVRYEGVAGEGARFVVSLPEA